MPPFKNMEEYQKWKAERQRQMSQRPHPGSAPSHLTGAGSTRRPQADSYIRRNLRSGENVVLEARITPLQTWAAIAILCVLFGPFSIAMVVIAIRDDSPGWFVLALLVAILFILLPSIYYYFRYKRAELSVTNMRVVEKTGILSDNVVDTVLDRIQNVVYKQPVLGKIFGFGTVTIRGVGTTIDPIRGIADPIGLRQAVFASP